VPATISQLPRGLLALLGIQNFGESPRQLADLVSPVLELLDLYTLSTRECAVGTNAAPALGPNLYTAPNSGYVDLSQAVPVGEVWYVHDYCVQVTPGAATSITIQPRIRTINASYGASIPMAITGAAGNPEWDVPSPFRGVWVSGGTQFGFRVNAITGAPGAVQGIAFVSRYRA
jgi:hypothetical protein